MFASGMGHTEKNKKMNAAAQLRRELSCQSSYAELPLAGIYIQPSECCCVTVDQESDGKLS